MARASGLSRDASEAELVAFAIDRAKRNLHVVLVVNSGPLSDPTSGGGGSTCSVVHWAAEYPALLRAPTVIAFDDWTHSVLESVAKAAMAGLVLPAAAATPTTAQVKPAITLAHIAARLHVCAAAVHADWAAAQGGTALITPASATLLVATFKRVYEEQFGYLTMRLKRLTASVDAMEGAEEAVEKLKAQVASLEPDLLASQVRRCLCLTHSQDRFLPLSHCFVRTD
jgi:hypothetical protein